MPKRFLFEQMELTQRPFEKIREGSDATKKSKNEFLNRMAFK